MTLSILQMGPDKMLGSNCLLGQLSHLSHAHKPFIAPMLEELVHGTPGETEAPSG